MKPACEACGAPDQAMREAMLRAGQRELTEPPSFRPPIYCPTCRLFEVEMIRTLRQDHAERDVADERERAGLPALSADDLTAAARARWDHRGDPTPVLEGTGERLA